jgi:hypothetical protein
MGTDIQFKPITDGLGFHPFSDGLPYAPVSKRSLAKPVPAPSGQMAGPPARPPGAPFAPKAPGMMMGTGAVAAGAPTFVPPRVNVPVARPAALTPAPAPSIVPAPSALEDRYGWLYLLKRVCAFAIDTGLNLTLAGSALSLALWHEDVSPELVLSGNLWLVGGAFLVFINWALILAQELAFGTTIGKRIFGLAVIGSAAALFVRAFFLLPGLAFGGLGVLWAALDRRKRCWHDRIAGIQPIELS